MPFTSLTHKLTNLVNRPKNCQSILIKAISPVFFGMLWLAFVFATPAMVKAQAQEQVVEDEITVELSQEDVATEESESSLVTTQINKPRFIFDGQVKLEEALTGPIIIGGGLVTIDGKVDQGDLLVFGGSVRITGEVEQDIYAAGGSVIIDGQVGGNVVAAGGEIQLTPTASVAGNLISAGERLLMKGNVGGSWLAAGKYLDLSGEIKQDLDFWGQKMVINQTASVAGQLQARVEEAPAIAQQANVPSDKDISVLETNQNKWRQHWLEKSIWLSVIGSIAWRFVLLSILVYFIKLDLKSLSVNLVRDGWSKAVKGAGLIIGLPLLGFLVFVTDILIPISILIFSLYLILWLISWVYPAWWLGVWLNQRVVKSSINPYFVSLIGAIAIGVIKYLPIVGAPLYLLLSAWGLGAMYSLVKTKLPTQ